MSHVDIRFTDKNSERFMLARRVYKVIEDLENEYLYPDSETLGGFKFRDGQYKFSQIDEGEWTDFDSENDYWGYKEDYAWFRHSFTVPERFAGRPVVYQLTPSASGPWNRSNPQFIMYFNGELRQGGDSNHSEIRLLDCAKGGAQGEVLRSRPVRLCCKTECVGSGGDNRLRRTKRARLPARVHEGLRAGGL